MEFNSDEIRERISLMIKENNEYEKSFCKKLNMSVNTINSIKDGKLPNTARMITIANALNTDLNYLITGEKIYSNLNHDELALLKLYKQLSKEQKNTLDEWFKIALRLPENNNLKKSALKIG